MSRKTFGLGTLAAAAVLAAGVGMAQASTVSTLGFQSNGGTAVAEDPMNNPVTIDPTAISSYSGSIVFGVDANSSLTMTGDSPSVYGAFLAGPATTSEWRLQNTNGITGAITLANGVVTGGNLTFTVVRQQSDPSNPANLIDVTNSFVTAIDPGATLNYNAVTKQFSVEGLTSSGGFSPAQSTYGGVSVAVFNDASPLNGYYGELFFNGGTDPDVRLSLDYAVVPVPAAVWGGLSLMSGLGVASLRRRRLARLSAV